MPAPQIGSRITGSLVLTLCLAANLSAQTTVVDFDSLSVGSLNRDIAAPYFEKGFALDSTLQLVDSYVMFGTADPGFTGHKSVAPQYQGPSYSLSRVDGKPFDLISIDLWEWRNQPLWLSPGYATPTFIGNVVGGATVQETVATNGVWDAQTISFPAFRNLTSVTWDTNDAFSDLHQVDNLVLVTVPEPSGIALAAIALVGLAVSRCHKE